MTEIRFAAVDVHTAAYTQHSI